MIVEERRFRIWRSKRQDHYIWQWCSTFLLARPDGPCSVCPQVGCGPDQASTVGTAGPRLAAERGSGGNLAQSCPMVGKGMWPSPNPALRGEGGLAHTNSSWWREGVWSGPSSAGQGKVGGAQPRSGCAVGGVMGIGQWEIMVPTPMPLNFPTYGKLCRLDVSGPVDHRLSTPVYEFLCGPHMELYGWAPSQGALEGCSLGHSCF